MRQRTGKSLRNLLACGFLASLAGLSAAETTLAFQCSNGPCPVPAPAVEFLRTYRASFKSPTHLAVDALGRVYIADPAAGRVTIRNEDGSRNALIEDLGNPISIAVEASGDPIYIGDGIDGRVTAFSFSGLPSFDLGQGTGEFGFASDIAIDAATGNVWVTDQLEHQIKVYDPGGNRLFNVGERGVGDGQFQSPMGIFVDSNGEVLIADQLNGRIQFFSREGTFSGSIGSKGSGSGRFNNPQGIWADTLGRIYVSDVFEDWVHVVNRSGATVSIIGGEGSAGAGAEVSKHPSDIVIDPFGRLFLSSSTTGRLHLFGIDGYSDPERFVPAEVILQPDTVFLASSQILKASIEVAGYRIETVATDSVSANGVAALPGFQTLGDVDGDYERDLTVAFEPAALAATLPTEGGWLRFTGHMGAFELEGFAHLLVVGDADGDGVPDGSDSCPSTQAEKAVNAAGCSLDQLCPCLGPAPGEPWKNHSRYVSCVAQNLTTPFNPPLDEQTQIWLFQEAAKSSCGK